MPFENAKSRRWRWWELHLRRIEAVNEKLNAVVTLSAERAIDEAVAPIAR